MLHRSINGVFIILTMMCMLALGSAAYGQKDSASSTDSAPGKSIGDVGPGNIGAWDKGPLSAGGRAMPRPSWNTEPGRVDRPSDRTKPRRAPSQSSPATGASPIAPPPSDKKPSAQKPQKLPQNWGPDPYEPTKAAPNAASPGTRDGDGKVPTHQPPIILATDAPGPTAENVRAPFRLPWPPLSKKNSGSTDSSPVPSTADRAQPVTHHPPVVLTTDAYGSAPSENVRPPFRLPPAPLQKKKSPDPVKTTDAPSPAPENFRAPFRLPPAPVQKKKSPDPVKSTDEPSAAPDNFRAPFRLPPAPAAKKKG